MPRARDREGLRDTLRTLARELRRASRMLRYEPATSLLVVLTLALGLGPALGIFSYLALWIWPTVEAPHPERVVYLDGADRVQVSQPFSWPDFQHYRRESRTVELVGWANLSTVVETAGESHFAWAQTVTGDYFPLFAAEALRGRLLLPRDESPDAPPVAVVSDRFWRRELGGDPRIVGRHLEVNGVDVAVVGVAPAGFQGAAMPAEIYLPVTLRPRLSGFSQSLERADVYFLQTLGRLAPGVALEAARGELAALARRLDEAEGVAAGSEGRTVTLHPAVQADTSTHAFATAARRLMAGVLLLLALATIHAAHLLLARSEARWHQGGVEAALGADRRRLALRSLLEGQCLALVALGPSMLLAWGVAETVERHLTARPVGLGDYGAGLRLVTLDGRILALGVAAALLVGLLAAATPALRLLRLRPEGALRRGRSGGGGAPPGAGRGGLVVTQVALAVVLLVASVLLVRSLMRTAALDPGFSTDGLLLASFYVPAGEVGQPEGDSGAPSVLGGFYRDLLEHARGLPGVTDAAVVRHAPLGGLGTVRVKLPGRPAGDEAIDVHTNIVSAGFFETVGIPVLRGRAFEERDWDRERRADVTPVVVNRAFVDAHLGGLAGDGGTVLGRRLAVAGRGDAPPRPLEILGVVEDARLGELVTPPRPIVFLPLDDTSTRRRMMLVLRAATGPQTLAAPLRRWLAEHPSGAGMIELVPFERQMGWALFYPRMNARLAGLFGIFALLLAAVGVAGLLAYDVSRRRFEIGVRLALGATRTGVRRHILGKAVRWLALGLALGLLAAWWGSRLLEGLLFGVEAGDPWSYLLAAGVLALAALLAADLPARRAARMDPREALRVE